MGVEIEEIYVLFGEVLLSSTVAGIMVSVEEGRVGFGVRVGVGWIGREVRGFRVESLVG